MKSRNHRIVIWSDDWMLCWDWFANGTWRTAHKVTSDRLAVERFARKWGIEDIPEHEED